MKYVNQINFALAAIAAVAVVYAFSQTYLAPAEPPRIVVQAPVEQESKDTSQEPEAERSPAPETPRAAQPRSLTAPAATPPPRTRSTGTPPRPEIGRPSAARPTPLTARERQAETPAEDSSPNSARQRPAPPDRREPAGVRRPAVSPADEDEEQEPAPRDFSQTPEGARRDQNRRGNPSPPPARSSMPEQRPR